MTSIKTATLTFHAPNNNGSFLQSYALQKVLIKKEINNTIINFYPDCQMEQYSVFRKSKNIEDVMRNGISVLHYRKLKRRFLRFQEMRDQYLTMTERLKTSEQVYDIVKQYDVIICGSDQIWNTKARDFSEAYFLPDVKRKKVTYAVSCGSNFEDVNQEQIIENAKTFSSVSVREDSTLAFFKARGLNKTTIVLDPTLLLEKAEYCELYDKVPIIKGKYIFLYTINYDSQVLANALRLSIEFDIPVYAAFTGYSSYKCRKYGIKVIYDMSPDRFLNLIEYATYVCSNSFHGIVFSIIFNKQFFRLCNVDIQGNCVEDDRIDGILNRLKVQSVNLEPNQQIVDYRIDNSETSRLLEAWKTHSVSFLSEALLGI